MRTFDKQFAWCAKKAVAVVTAVTILAASMTVGFGNLTVMAATVGNWQDNGNPATAIAVGSGTTDDPYQINSAAELAYMAKQVNAKDSNYPNAYYKLTADIDLSDHFWTPIGLNFDIPFSGVFDGNGHKITGLKIGTSETPDATLTCAGLFGCATSTSCAIKNLGIDVAVYSSGRARVGGLAGNISGGNMSNCYASGTIECSAGAIGGGNLVGTSYSTIVNCYATGRVATDDSSGGAYIGGLVGFSGGQIINSYSRCDIDMKTGGSAGRNDVGVLAGQGHIVLNCYATGKIEGGPSSFMGGLLGNIDAASDVVNSYAACVLTGGFSKAGLVGEAETMGNPIRNGYYDNSSALIAAGSAASMETTYGLDSAVMQGTAAPAAGIKYTKSESHSTGTTGTTTSAFLDALNSGRGAIPAYNLQLVSIKAKYWVADSSSVNRGYPVFSDTIDVATPTIDPVSDQTTTSGRAVTFTATASVTDGGTLSYQWQSLTNGSNWTDVTGATSSTYTTGNLSISDSGMKYRCVVTNTKYDVTASATSNAATLTVNPPATAAKPTINPVANQTASEGGTATFTVAASVTDGGTLSYQWYKCTYDMKNYTEIVGATKPTYTTGILSISDDGYFYSCMVKNTNNGAISCNGSNLAKLTVTAADTTTPAAPTVKPVNNKNTTVAGTAEANSTVTVKDSAGKTLGTATADSNGNYSVTIPAQTAGTVLSVTATDAAKNESTATKVTVSAVDTTAPDAPTAKPVNNKNTTVAGTAEANSTVTVKDSAGKTLGTATADSSGNYSVTIPAQTAGTVLSVTATDAAKNESTATIVTVTAADTPVLPTPADTVKDKIDALPNPDAASDKTIQDNQQNIKDTKQLYDALSSSDRNSIDTARKSKLEKLIDRLDALLVIVPKDPNTGITAAGIGTSVLIPELADQNTRKVLVKLSVNKVPDTNRPANIVKAINVMSDSGKKIIATYDVSLLKSVFGTSGNLLSSKKVSNSEIVGYITIQIPVPAEYSNNPNLTVAYIDDNGNVTPLTTTIVTENGVKYLRFTTNHFSEYAIATTVTSSSSSLASSSTTASSSAQQAKSSPFTGDTGYKNIICTSLIAVTALAVLVVNKRKKGAHFA